MLNRIKCTIISADFDEPLRPLALAYKGWLKRDCVAAGLFGIASVIVGVFAIEWSDSTFAFVATAFGLALWKPIIDADCQRRYTDYFVSSYEVEPLNYPAWVRQKSTT